MALFGGLPAERNLPLICRDNPDLAAGRLLGSGKSDTIAL